MNIKLVSWVQSYKQLLFCIKYLHIPAEHWAKHVLFIIEERETAWPNKANIKYRLEPSLRGGYDTCIPSIFSSNTKKNTVSKRFFNKVVFSRPLRFFSFTFC